jgi:hypothetical protein
MPKGGSLIKGEQGWVAFRILDGFGSATSAPSPASLSWYRGYTIRPSRYLSDAHCAKIRRPSLGLDGAMPTTPLIAPSAIGTVSSSIPGGHTSGQYRDLSPAILKNFQQFRYCNGITGYPWLAPSKKATEIKSEAGKSRFCYGFIYTLVNPHAAQRG